MKHRDRWDHIFTLIAEAKDLGVAIEKKRQQRKAKEENKKLKEMLTKCKEMNLQIKRLQKMKGLK